MVEMICCFSAINGNRSHMWYISLKSNPVLRSVSTDTLHLPKPPQTQTMRFLEEIKAFCCFQNIVTTVK